VLVPIEVTAFMPIMSFEWEFGAGITFGSLAQSGVGKLSTDRLLKIRSIAVSDYFDRTVMPGAKNYTETKEKENSLFGLNFKALARQKLDKSLFLGGGIEYMHFVNNCKFTEKMNSNSKQHFDDGDGVVEVTDFDSITNSSSEAEVTQITTTDIIRIPLGVEYKMTPTLALRFGVIWSWMLTSIESIYELKKAQEPYTNIQNADGSSSTQYSSTNSANKTRVTQELNEILTQTNLFSLGLGYAAGSNLQFDIAMETDMNETFGSGKGYFDASKILFNATLLF